MICSLVSTKESEEVSVKRSLLVQGKCLEEPKLSRHGVHENPCKPESGPLGIPPTPSHRLSPRAYGELAHRQIAKEGLTIPCHHTPMHFPILRL